MKIWLTSHQSAYKLVFCLYSVNLVPKKSLITSCQLPNIAILFFSHPDFGQNHGRDVNLLHFCVNFMQVWFVYPLQSLLDFSSNRRLIVFIPSKILVHWDPFVFWVVWTSNMSDLFCQLSKVSTTPAWI